MGRTFSLDLVVVLLLAFAVTEASRGRTNQVDGQKAQSRGSTRFYSQSTTESSSFSASSITASERPQDKTVRSEAIADVKKHETHSARESPFRSRSKLKLSKRTNDSSDASRTNARHLNTSDDNLRSHLKSFNAAQVAKEKITKGRHDENKENVFESQMPKRQTASRRIISDTPSVLENNRKLDLETFSTSPDHSRSKTGRKIYANFNEKAAKDQTEPARKFKNIENKNSTSGSGKEEMKSQSGPSKIIENFTSNASISKRMDTKNVNTLNNQNGEIKDVLLSGSESIRVDIPLTENGDEENAVPNLLTSVTISSVNVSPRQGARTAKEKQENNNIARSSAKKSRNSDRSKSRGRSKANDPYVETANSGSVSRKRVSSSGRSSSNSRSRSKAKNSRSRSAQKSRDIAAEGRSGSRSRYADTDFGTSANGQTEIRRSSSTDRRTSEAKRRSGGDGRSAKITKTKIEEQDTRTQSRGRSRVDSNLDVTTSYIPKATLAEATTVSTLATEVTTSNSAFAVTRAPIVTRTSSSTDRVSRVKGRDRGESSRSKKPPKEDFFNHGLGFRGRKSSTEGSFSNVAELKSTTPKSETQLRGNPGWTLRRRPSHVNQEISSTTSTSINRDQTNEIISSNDSSSSTEIPLSNMKAGRRGTKRPKANQENSTASGSAAKSVTRGSKTFNKSESYGLPKGVEVEESDNYPPAFRARLSQLKVFNSKPTTGKSLTRTTYQATKPSTAHLFSERSKMKLDLARRLIKPELNVDENNFDITTAPYSKGKEVALVSESKNIEKTTKATKPVGVRIAHGSLINESTLKEKYDARDRWKVLGTRKSLTNRNFSITPRPLAVKKNRVITEKTITSSFAEGTSVKNVIELNTISRENPTSHHNAISAEEMVATTIDTTKIRAPTSLNKTMSREEISTLANTVEATNEENIVTTEPTKTTKMSVETIELIDHDIYDAKKETTTAASDTALTTNTESVGILTTEFAQEITLAPAITMPSSTPLSSTVTSSSKTLYPVYMPNVNDDDSPQSTESLNDVAKNSFRPRYSKQEPDKVVSMVTSMTVGPTSRYIRKKAGVFTPYDPVPKTISTESTLTQTKRREFRPRTATYRRHSEIPTSVAQPTVTKEDSTDITITPKPTKYHSSVKSTPSSTRSLPTEPLVSVRIDASNDTTPQGLGITDSSNGNSGSSNVFSPTRSAFLGGNTTTLLEQLRSTVAPLLNTLGNKTPVFSGAYSNVDTGNSAPRITPNGSPPRFSARYKGAELFVRKPSVGQSMVPSITTSTTTASTPIENSSSSSIVNIISPGEPRFVTYYQALESASIKNENLQADENSQQQRLTGGVMKVDSNATIPNGVSNDTANNDTASPAIVPNATTSSSDSSVDTTTQSADSSLASRLNTENTPDDSLAAVSTTVQTPTNPATNEETTSFNVNTGETTPFPTSESIGITTPDNTISSTPPNNTSTSELPTTTETTNIIDTTTNIDVITETLPTTNFTPVNNSRLAESTNTSVETTEITTSTTQATSTDVFAMTALQSTQTASDVPSTTTFSSVMESVTITQAPSEQTISPSFSDMFGNIETNTIQSSGDTAPQTTDIPIKSTSENARSGIMELPDVTTSEAAEAVTAVPDGVTGNIETNTVQQPEVTTFQTTEITSTAEIPSTTEAISNAVNEGRTTPAPITTTYRVRLIDFAQDILSRLQDNLSTTTASQGTTVTTTLSDLASTISDSSLANTENPMQSENDALTTTTLSLSSTLNTEATTSQNALGTESAQATTGATNGLQEMTIQNTVGSDIALATAQGQFNGRESNSRDMPDSSIIMTEQRTSSIVDDKSLDSESTTATQNTGNLENSSRNMVDAEVVTVTLMPTSRDFVAENDPRSSNDTLLTELMTIAKTLFSEAMNDTRLEPNRISNLETTTVPGINNSTQVNNAIESNKQSQFASSSNTLEATSVSSETPATFESTSERTDITTSVGLAGDENINRAPVVGSEISLMEFNENAVDVGDITTVVSQTQTTNAIKPVTSNTNSKLIANMPYSQLSNQLSNNTDQPIISSLEFAQQSQFTTVPSNNVELPDQSLDFTTNNPVVIDSVTTTEERILSDINESTTSSISDSELTELATSAAVTEINDIQTNVVDTTNQTPELTTTEPVPDLQVTNNQLLTNVSVVITTPPTVFDTGSVIDTSDNQSFSTELPTESISNLISTTIDTTTNQFGDITTNVPDQTLTDLVSESPNFIARFQDTTATTAQGTAGSGIIQPAQTTETTVIPTVTTPLTTPMPTSPSMFPESSIIDTTTTPSSAVTTTETTSTMTTSTATLETTTAISMSETTTPTVDIKENLISNETSTDSTSTTQSTTVVPNESEDLNMISRSDVGQEQATTTTTTATTMTSTVPSTSMATTTTMSNTQTSTFERVAIRPTPAPAGPLNIRPYLGSFGGSQTTPPPRLSSSSKAPVRDYLIYGIYPNKTIVRKRPEDNLIDARNVDSPYVIFGIYPDGRLVRKFPNGTIIPDSPRNPVEVVFTLSTTTTTNRPAPRPYYNQANQAGPYNQYQVPAYYNNRRPVDELMRNTQSPGTVDFGLTGNAIGVSPGPGPYFPGPLGTPASVPSSNKMSDILLSTQMGTLPNAASTIGNLQMPTTSNIQTPVSSIFQDRDMSEGSQTKVTSNQANSVYIGQDKFINYQIDGTPNVNPKVVDVKINSVATSVSEGPLSSSSPSFENVLNNQPGGVITAPPGFPWRDPLDQIFGITTNSPIQTASVASNQLDEPVENNASIAPRPISPFVEVFTPTVSTSVTTPEDRLRASTTSPTSTITTNQTPTITTTTPISTTAGRIAVTTTSTSTTSPTTTTTTTASTTTRRTTTPATSTATVTTTITPETSTSTTTTANITPTIPRLATTASAIITKTVPSVTINSGIASSTITTRSAIDMLNRLQTNIKENSFGTTFGDLAFLNSLLQNNVQTTTPKTLSEVEQLLANRILALALAKPGPTRSPKAIQNVGSNIIDNSINSLPSPGPSSEPIIIDLLPYSSPSPPSWKSSTDSSTSTIKKYVETNRAAATQKNIIPVTTTTTTRAPVVITAKPVTTAKPKIITTPRPGLGVSLWRALFGANLLETTTTASTTKQKITVKAVTPPKPVQVVTQKPTQIVQSSTQVSHIMSAAPIRHTTIRSVDISDIRMPSPEVFTDNINSASDPTSSSISTTQQALLNNPNPRLSDVSTSTFSPEDDAKFLIALLRSINADSKPSIATTTGGITEDDEAFLRAILSNQASISTTTASSSTEVNSAALLALLLKQQGIEPSTPAIKLREQLQLASLDLTTQSQPFSTTTRPTTTINRSPSSASTARTVTKVVTPKPTSRSKPLQTTTWSPSSTYPPPLFGGAFSNIGSSGGNSGSGIVTATRAFGQLLGAAITGAAQQLQSLLRNGTRNVAG